MFVLMLMLTNISERISEDTGEIVALVPFFVVTYFTAAQPLHAILKKAVHEAM